MQIPTTERLAAAIREQLGERGEEMAKKAASGWYDDYKSELTFPLVQLVRDLRALGAEDLVIRAQAGEFDATEEEHRAYQESIGLI